MSYDQGLLQRCLDVLSRIPGTPVHHRNTFSMRGLMVGRRMFAAVGEDALLVKLRPEEYDAALGTPGVEPFAPGGERPMGTWVLVSSDIVADDPELQAWLEAGLRALR